MKTVNKILPFLIVIALSVFSFLPLLSSGFFPMHDDTQVARIYGMAKSLSLGMFPVRWVLDLGYGLGYPIFNFYAPLSYYFGAFFVLFGVDALLATKITMIFAMVFSGIFMYLFAKELFGKSAGVVASAFYVYAPYHALDLYVRGDLAESFAYAFIPLVFFGLIKLYKKLSFFYVAITSFGFSGLILSHNLTALMVAPFLIFCAVLITVVFKKDQRIKAVIYLFGSLVMGVILSFFYWFPALFELNNTNVISIIGGGSHFPDHFACLSQLWASNWGFGGSTKGCIDGLSLMVGKLHVATSFLTLLIGILFLFTKKYRQMQKRLLVIFLLFLGFLFCGFLTLEYSSFLWQAVPLMAFFQFPWRFLLMASFFSSVLAGAFVYLMSLIPFKKVFPHFSIELSALLIIFVLFLNTKYFVPQKILMVDSKYYTNEYALKWTASKISDEYLPKGTQKPKTADEALLNKPIFEFEQTPVEKVSNFVSLTGIIALSIGIIKFRKKYD